MRKDGKEPEHEHQHASSSRGVVDINGRVYGSLIRQVNFEMFKESSKDHLVRKIPSGNQQMFRKHEVNDKTKDVDSNAFQKAIDEQGDTTSNMTIFS